MSNEARIIGRYTLTGTLKLVSPLLIRAGVYNNMSNDTVDDIVVTYHDGQPFIPGTSLAGVLKALVSDFKENPMLVNKLFGDIEQEDSNQSTLQINDVPLSNAQIHVRDGIAVHQYLGVTKKGAKYDFEIVDAGAEGDIKIDCIIREHQQSYLTDIKDTLEYIANIIKNGINIGARTLNGLGLVVSENLKLQYYDFYKSDDVIAWLMKQPGQNINIPERFMSPETDCIVNMSCHFEDTLLIKSIFEEAWETQGKLCIPGSSLKGVLRHHSRQILDVLGIKNDMEDDLFGNSVTIDKESHKGKFKVSEIYLDKFSEDAKQVEQNRIRVDRFTGGVMNGALFQDHPLRNTMNRLLTFPLQLTISKCSREEAGLVLLLVKDLMTGRITVGANRTIGAGRIKGDAVTIKYLNETYQIDGDGKLVRGECKQLESFIESFISSSKEAVNE